jgi:glycosyltransferase involved in cell wall biosynthesis
MVKQNLSIIIPVYNGGRYIARCLGSVLRQQDSEKYEIIVVNDGSTDNTPNILDGFAQKYKNIHVIHQKNAGVSMARNNGIDASSGEYVTFVDCDDMVGLNASAFEDYFMRSQYKNLLHNMRIACNKVEIPKFNAKCFSDNYFVNMLSTAYRFSADVVFAGKITINDAIMYGRSHAYVSDVVYGSSPDDKDAILQHADVRENANFALYKRDMLDEHNLRFIPNMQLDEDILFCMLSVIYANNVATVKDSIYFYNRHDDTLSNITDKSEMKKKYVISNIQRFSVLLNELAKHPEYNVAFNRWMKRFARLGLIYDDCLTAYPPRMCYNCPETKCGDCIYAEHMREQVQKNIQNFCIQNKTK